MNSRKMTIIAAIGLLVIFITAFLFFRKALKENPPVPVQPAAQEGVEKTSQAGYLIPGSTVHSLDEMKERIRKAEEESRVSQGTAASVGPETAQIGAQAGAGGTSDAALTQSSQPRSMGTPMAGGIPENGIPTADEINAQIKNTEEQLRQSQQIAANMESEAEMIRAQTIANPVGIPSPVSGPSHAGGTSSVGGYSQQGAPAPVGGYSPSGTSQSSQQGGSTNPQQSNEGTVSAGEPSQSGTSQSPQQSSGTVNSQGDNGGNVSGGEAQANRGGIITY